MPGQRAVSSAPSAKRRLDFGDDEKDTQRVHSVQPVGSTSLESSVQTNLVAGTPQKKKRRTDSGIAGYFSSPPPATTTAVVTPEKDSLDGETEDDAHVPRYIHKNLGYKRRGDAVLDPSVEAAFALVEEHCGIPPGFENDRKYGPLSGTCFEQRLLDAYDKGMVRPKIGPGGNTTGIEICTHCASLGHGRDECPVLI
ncbi:unnamed protein product [Pseudo-nitzschia multistriata]|uniref:Uncharacterized protein n=1 Tax=Pseudo-nitzschia multistriata TaxID=183589 RepID=A0A448Z666_9STRA|nr:unnamed protein product [Pseudo-nitzschia multistriata]